ncbi:MAG TPA: tetratricopeptide repeat protein [Sandaracinaceae bacterium LLY-WYZ-13_1]|nr:tetratricopeptide repeat protein [Sandaracinaceae bacterium LLY-WYZ-13_1]
MRRNRLALLVVASALLAGGLPLVVGAQDDDESSASSEEAETLPEGIPRVERGVCITPGAESNVQDCPEGAPPPSKRAGARPTGPNSDVASHFRETKRQEEESKTGGMTGPSIEIDAATRRNRERIQVRALQLLQREVRVLERLVGRTRAGDPRGADYLLRLAETYFELQTFYNTRARSLDQPIFEARQSKNASKVRQLQQRQEQAEQRLQHFRQEAIRTYARLVRDYPNYRDMDRVLFSLAFGLEEMRQFQRARQVYHRLIKGYPQSQYIPHAYLSFAEYYFGEGDMRAAQQFYSKVTEIPPERNPVYGYALYKQAWAMYNLEDFQGALTQFVRTIEFAQQNPDARDAANLARQSRRELVLPYSRVGTPRRALEFFRRYATNEDQALEMLESLAELYYDTGAWPETIQIYHRLMAERPDGNKLCYWQSRVTNAVISSRPKDEQVREVRRLVDLHESFTGADGREQAAIQECSQATAAILVELATAWHREAIGTDDQPGTNDRNTMRAATAIYRLVLERFPNMDQMEFPNIDRRDWPTEYRISYFYAELLWRMEDWAQCGPAFDRVVELDPQGEFTQDAAYAAVLCYNNLYQQQYSSRETEVRGEENPCEDIRNRRRRRQCEREQEEMSEAERYVPRELSDTESGMLQAFQRFVCYVSDSDELPTIKYRRARIYYESNRYEEAAMLFRDIALNHEDSELSEYAANLYLDSLNILGTQWQRSQCIDEIRENIEPLSGMYCANQDDRDAHPDLCGVLDQLRCDTLRLQAEAAQRERRYRDAATTYVTIAREHRECGNLDEVLYNAAINYEAARLLGRAIRVRTILIQNFPESDLARRAVYLVGANYHALAIYNQAAEWYERFAREYPGEDGSDCTDEQREAGTCAIAHEALQNAVFFRLGLGQEDQAVEDAELFERNYRRRMPRETSQVMFSLGSIYERQEDWNRVFGHYRGWLRSYGRRALPHEVIRANVQMGRAKWELDDKRDAERYFEAAVRTWTRGAGEDIAELEEVSDEDRQLYLARAKDATSEALFYLAEYEYAEFRQIRFPRFRGGRSIQRVQRWAENDFAEWLQEKREALTEAEEAYNRIAELEIPEWEIAGAARVGEMYRSFMDQIRQAPIPEEIENDDELYGIYVDALENAARPLQQQAMDKFEFCLTRATAVRWFNEFSEQCEQELNQLDRAQYPMAAELRGEADYVQRQLARPGAVSLDQEEQGEVGAVGGEDNSIPEGAAGQ